MKRLTILIIALLPLASCEKETKEAIAPPAKTIGNDKKAKDALRKSLDRNEELEKKVLSLEEKVERLTKGLQDDGYPHDRSYHGHISNSVSASLATVWGLRAAILLAKARDDAQTKEILQIMTSKGEMCIVGEKYLVDNYDAIMRDPETNPSRAEKIKSQKGLLDQANAEIRKLLSGATE